MALRNQVLVSHMDPELHTWLLQQAMNEKTTMTSLICKACEEFKNKTMDEKSIEDAVAGSQPCSKV